MSRWQSVWEAEDADGDDDEDAVEDEGIVEEEEDLEGEWELDPNDPSHPDHDLSVAAGYGGWEPASKPIMVRRGMILLLTLLAILGLLIPILARLG